MIKTMSPLQGCGVRGSSTAMRGSSTGEDPVADDETSVSEDSSVRKYTYSRTQIYVAKCASIFCTFQSTNIQWLAYLRKSCYFKMQKRLYSILIYASINYKIRPHTS